MSAKNVEIITAHNIRIDYELATFSDRLIAFIIDIAVMVGWLILLLLFSSKLDAQTRGLFLSFLFIPVFFTYHLICETFFGGQSIGKKTMGLKVIKLNGHNPSLGDCLLRWVLRMIDIAGTSGAIAAIMVSSTDRNQRLGDISANTVVIRLNPPNRYTIADIMTIQSKSNYQPTYNGVTVFTDEDMLLIKNSIERMKLYPHEQNKKLIAELTEKVQLKLNIQTKITDPINFLRTVLQDYIVLTR